MALILARRRKEAVVIDAASAGRCVIVVEHLGEGRVVMAIQAPLDWTICRAELLQKRYTHCKSE